VTAPFGLVVTCEHGGARVPRRYASIFRDHREVLRSHRGWDPGALLVARSLARALGAPNVASEVSRLLVDLNRSETHPRLFSEWTRPLHELDREAVLDVHYRPHRRAVRAAIEKVAATKRAVIHLAIHSFTPELDTTRRTMDVGLLYDPSRALERRLCVQWKAAVERLDPQSSVRRNAPYRGVSDGLTRALRREWPSDRYAGVELELNQESVRRWRQRRDLTQVLLGALVDVLRSPSLLA
jgi:predicted N-formylglutamate amidohydrolase